MSAIIHEEGIDQERIINNNSVPNEYFCVICQFLLWKPRSCASCQQIFCERCLRTWLENSAGQNTCPFRCQSFQDHPCPPAIQSLLSELHIRCRNASFGCTEVLPYDQLEHHETVSCQYRSQQCPDCFELVLITNFDYHRQTPNVCIPRPIKCAICHNNFEKKQFKDHFSDCIMNRFVVAVQTPGFDQHDNGLTTQHFRREIMKLYEHQRTFSQKFATIHGADMVEPVHLQNRSYIYRIYINLYFILLNWKKLPFVLVYFPVLAIFRLLIISCSLFYSHRRFASSHMYVVFVLITLLLPWLLSYGPPFIYSWFSDTTIIGFYTISSIIFVYKTTWYMHIFESHRLINRPFMCLLLWGLSLLGAKLILLFFRFYYWLIPEYITMSLLFYSSVYIMRKVSHII